MSKGPEWKDGIRVSIKSGNKNTSKNDLNDSSDSDSEFDDFLNDPEMKKLHEQRLQQLKQQYKERNEKLSKGHGHYDEMDEKDMLKMACDTEYVIVHFYSDEFERCKIMDLHLKKIAPKHVEARFVKLNVRKSPFLCKRWKIRTLPSICIIINGMFQDKIIGFTDLGNKDDFPTGALVKRLIKSGVIKGLDGKHRLKCARTNVLTDI